MVADSSAADFSAVDSSSADSSSLQPTQLLLGSAGVLIMSCGTFVCVEGSQLRGQDSKLVEGKTSTQFSG